MRDSFSLFRLVNDFLNRSDKISPMDKNEEDLLSR